MLYPEIAKQPIQWADNDSVESISNVTKYRIAIGLPQLSEAQIKNRPPIQDIERIDKEDPVYNQWRKKQDGLNKKTFYRC